MNINQVENKYLILDQLEIIENETSEEAKDLWIKISKNLGRSFFKLGKNGPSLDKFDEILNLLPNDLDVLLLKVSIKPYQFK